MKWTKEKIELLESSDHVPAAVLAEMLGCSIKCVYNKRGRLGRRYDPLANGDDPASIESMDSSSYEESSNAAQIEKTFSEPIKSLDELIEKCKIDISVWEVERWRCKAYAGFVKGPDKKPIPIQLYSVSANLRRRSGINFEELTDTLIEKLKQWQPVHAPSISMHRDTGYMLELSIPDLHVGKLSWAPETGESYDSKIAADLFHSAVDDIISRSIGYQFDEIALIVGNDFLNADNSANTTTAGTPQSSDSRHAKMFETAIALIQETVEQKLRNLAPKIKIIIVPGNHDEQSTYFLGKYMEAYFRTAVDVEIDNSPRFRKYHRFGEVLLGFTHGNNEKHVDLPLIMATECPDLWKESKFREWHVGHLHQRRSTRVMDLSENRGVVVRILPSLCSADAWHSKHGYIGNIRSAEGYIWHKSKGLSATVSFNV